MPNVCHCVVDGERDGFPVALTDRSLHFSVTLIKLNHISTFIPRKGRKQGSILSHNKVQTDFFYPAKDNFHRTVAEKGSPT